MSRRSPGEGSISERKDGRFESRIMVDDPETGRRRRLVAYAKTKTGAIDQLRKLQERARKAATAGSDRELLGAYLMRWLAGKSQIRPATRRSYEGMIRLHIAPSLGNIPIGALRKAQVTAWMTRLQRDGASPRKRQLALLTLTTALDQAQDDEIIARNVAALVDPPRVPKAEMSVWTPVQVSTFLEALRARDDRLFAFYALALDTGMRQGELMGLRWSDVDLDAGKLSVQNQLDRVDRDLAEPKTARGRRSIDISSSVIAELKKHRERILAEGHPRPWVFPSESDGKPLRPGSVQRSSFMPTVALADAIARDAAPEGPGVPLIRFHDLRHTAVLLMRLVGLDWLVISRRIGHSDPAFTMRVYGHLLPDAHTEAASAVESILGPMLGT